MKEAIGFSIIVNDDGTSETETYYSEWDMFKKSSLKEKLGYVLETIFPFPPFKTKLCYGIP